ncbi:MAG TPA: hypothetical protein PKK10_12585 [Woeseiaceae bacterium]|nr:hypothetical protein [Woeseiaceae bacterium]
MVRQLVGAVAGIVTAVVTVMIAERISLAMYPMPADFDSHDSGALATHVAGAPAAVLLVVLAGYLLASFDGTLVASLTGRARPAAYAMLIGLLMIAATASNLIMIPHPTWFAVAAIVGIIIATWAAVLFATRLIGPKGDR